MNCPICLNPITPEPNKYYKDYPGFTCVNMAPGGPIHYSKHFDADWSYTRYLERATIYPYRVLNYYNYREGRSDFGAIQLYEDRYNGNIKISKYFTIVSTDRCIKIPPKDIFIEKMKTLILFS